MSFSPPNYTQTPNELFALQSDMEETELRVTLAIVRATFGWNAGGQLAHLTLDMLTTETGLSKQGVLNGVKAGKERGTLTTIKQGRDVYYGLVVSGEGAAAAAAKGQPSRPKLIAPNGLLSGPKEAQKGQLSRPNEKPKGQLSGPNGSTQLTQSVYSVDFKSQLSGPRSALFAPVGQEKTGAQRQQTDRKDIKDKQQQQGEGTPAPAAAAVVESQTNGEGQPSGADRTGTPTGVNPANATTGHGLTQVQANGGAGQATTPEKIPAARGATLAALHSALRPLPAQDLIDELPSRQHWLDIPADRVREMHDEYRARLGSKGFRGDLIDALDREARQLATPNPTAPTTPTNVSDIVRARIQGRK
ncbi:hypothetical protein [Deinococcus soli (ex Cha et al. 2016)]|uniref:Uncharacterized protein n=1 Tax=Deinococcus soli (ex Cha et al. 2016) TaxID=1309411 RepID=A0ACC6KLT1_9DEIO|nr:hypothetical protein [Deinococcus soli (ex Cha et al. 2016)]MDR6753463.1 hypothetical protein [Deinococcus soli (ex Cha et al. 2016)]